MVLIGLLGVVEIARAGIHPGETDQAFAAVGHLVEQVLADWAVDYLLHVLRVSKHIREIEHVEFVDHRAERANGNAREGDGTDLGLLDGFLLTAKLHRRIHLHAQAPIGGFLEFLADILDRHHGRIAGRVHVRGLQNQFLLSDGGA